MLRFIARLALSSDHQLQHPLEAVRSISHTFPETLYRNYAVTSTVTGAWQTRRWLALAVELRNESTRPVALTPTAVAGRWYAAGFLHGRLLPHGKRGAKSVMFLIRRRDADLG